MRVFPTAGQPLEVVAFSGILLRLKGFRRMGHAEGAEPMVHKAVRQSSSEVADAGNSGHALVAVWLFPITKWRTARVRALDRPGMQLETSSRLPRGALKLGGGNRLNALSC